MEHQHFAVRTALIERLRWPEHAAEQIAACAHIVTYEKDATVFHAGESTDLVYVLLSGEVKVYYGTADGERLLVTIARSGQILGFTDLDSRHAHDAKPGQPFAAQALSRCTIAIIARARVVAGLSRLPAADLLRILGDLEEEWVRLSCRLLKFLTMDVRGRLECAIREIADKFGIDDARGRFIGLKLSHEDFAELVGASRPMVSKHLQELAAAGVFVKHNARYILAQAEALDRVTTAKSAPRLQHVIPIARRAKRREAVRRTPAYAAGSTRQTIG